MPETTTSRQSEEFEAWYSTARPLANRAVSKDLLWVAFLVGWNAAERAQRFFRTRITFSDGRVLVEDTTVAGEFANKALLGGAAAQTGGDPDQEPNNG